MNHLLKTENCELEQAFQTIEDRFGFVWGVASIQNPSFEASLHTLNDIDIVYDKHDNVYMLELETTYRFEAKKDECEYLVNLLRKFAEWMDSQKISRNEKLAIWDGITFVSRTIENLYAQFLCYVNGYCALYGNDESSPKIDGYIGDFTGISLYEQKID